MDDIETCLQSAPDHWHGHPVWMPMLREIFLIDWKIPDCCRFRPNKNGDTRRLSGYNIFVKHFLTRVKSIDGIQKVQSMVFRVWQFLEIS